MDELIYLFEALKLKYVILTAFFLGVVVLSKFYCTNDLPPCPHVPTSAGAVRPYGCFGHKADSIDIASLKTGDILLLSYGDLRSVFGSVFYNSLWVHTAVVFVDSKSSEAYVFEAANYFPPYSGQVIRIPILKWMRINRNVKAVALLPINKKIPDCKFEQAMRKYEKENITVESLGHTWLRFLRTKRISDLPENSIFSDKFGDESLAKTTTTTATDFQITCHELTMAVLQEAEVVEKDISPCSFFPSTVYNRKFNCINGFFYALPRQVSFHEFTGDASVAIEY